jgi:hypothetical protein
MHRVAVFTLVLLVAAPSLARACSCPASTLCSAFGQSTAVFVGRAESVVPQGRTRAETRFAVIERLRGEASGVVSIVGPSGGCGLRFVPGRRYLVYASRDDDTGRLTVSACSRTQPIESADADLAYARGLAQTPHATHVEGVVMSDGSATAGNRTLVEGRAVVFEKDGERLQAIAGRDGRFSIETLRPGRYRLSLDLPPTLLGEVWPPTIDVAASGGCLAVRATVAFDGRVRGRVVDASARGVPGLSIDILERRRGVPDVEGARHIVTNVEGRYEISRLPPGDYIVGINSSADADRAGLPRLFYPGVDRLARAQRIRLAGGQAVVLDDLVIPATLKPVLTWGIVLDPDGRPAPDARVFVKPGDTGYILGAPIATDFTGRFAVTLFSGPTYRIFADARRATGTAVDSSDELTIVPAADMPPVRILLRRRY